MTLLQMTITDTDKIY